MKLFFLMFLAFLLALFVWHVIIPAVVILFAVALSGREFNKPKKRRKPESFSNWAKDQLEQKDEEGLL